MSSFRYLTDLPKAATEVANCEQFLREFRDDDGNFKYWEHLVLFLVSYLVCINFITRLKLPIAKENYWLLN
jgi:hypothetical protein